MYCLLNRNLMSGFLGNAKYTRTLARQYQDHANKKLMNDFPGNAKYTRTFPFPSRRSPKMYAKDINIPEKCPWRVPLA